MSKAEIDWKVIAAMLVVIGWLIFQFRADVNATGEKVTALYGYHDGDIDSVLREFDKTDATRDVMLSKLAGNDMAHKSIDEQLAKMDEKLEKIYDLLIERGK